MEGAQVHFKLSKMFPSLELATAMLEKKIQRYWEAVGKILPWDLAIGEHSLNDC